MNINDIIPLLVDACLYYYTMYYKIILNEEVVISSDIYYRLSTNIYNTYSNAYTNCYVKDIMILDDIYGKQYELNKEIDIDTICQIIYDYLINHTGYYNTSIPVISLSPNEIENYVVFDHLWIKWTIDQYRIKWHHQ